MRFGWLVIAKVTSKIIFINNDLDTWSKKGFEEEINNDLWVFIIKNGAHDLDLRVDQYKNAESKKNNINQIERLIAKWIDIELIWSIDPLVHTMCIKSKKFW